MPAWLIRLGWAVAEGLGLGELVRGAAWFALALLVVAVLAAVSVVTAPFRLAGSVIHTVVHAIASVVHRIEGTPQSPPDPRLGLWAAGLVTQEARRAGLPPLLVLAVLDHESHGDYTATHVNPDGSTDAGLMQVNSRNWAGYGLADDPYDPAANVRAGVAILAGDLRGAADLRSGLEAYNGGGSGYADAVLADADALESAGPQLAVAPLPAAGDGTQTLLVAAWAPIGPATRFAGRDWPDLEPPATVAASAGTVVACAEAPEDLRGLLPPDATCWLVVGAPVDRAVTVRAAWRVHVTETVTDPHGQPHTVSADRDAELAATVPAHAED
jgi:hypothetical protein